MLVRLFVLLIAMVLVAVPADSACAETCADAAAELALGDDALVTYVVNVAAEHGPIPLATPSRRDAPPPMPALGRIFRPPRGSLA